MNLTACISRRRAELMGCATLLIICFHAFMRLPAWPLWNYVVWQNGNMGVDFFVVLSGFGCVFSLQKNRDIGAYYARRLARLLPSYYVALALAILLAGYPSLKVLAANLIPIGTWVGVDESYWYVSACLLYYILVPLLMALVERARFPRAMFLALIGCASLVIPYITRESGPAIAIMHLPSLAAGVGLGVFHHTRKNRRDDWVTAALLALLWLVGFALARRPMFLSHGALDLMSRSQARRLQKALRAPAILAVAALALEGVERTPLRRVNALLRAVGHRSLEMYLGHAIIRYACQRWLGLYGWKLLLCMLALSYPLALGIDRAGRTLLALARRLPILRADAPKGPSA